MRIGAGSRKRETTALESILTRWWYVLVSGADRADRRNKRTKGRTGEQHSSEKPLKTFRSLLVLLSALFVLTAPQTIEARPLHHHHRRHHHHGHRAAVRQSVTVWGKTNSGVYHYRGQRWYGNTKNGKYISEAAALAEGDRLTENGQ